jgi:peptidoglycan/xylan/chitin deacetylase (PgdA/CDA1 family)
MFSLPSSISEQDAGTTAALKKTFFHSFISRPSQVKTPMSQNDTKLAILTYHSLDESGSVISTSPNTFRHQMKILAESTLSVLSLREAAKCLKEKGILPSNSVSITFDDGFRNVHDVGFPVLKEFGFSATIFLVTDYCGKDNRWYGQPDHIPVLDLMNWDEISEMAGPKIEFGVHTATHPDLTKIPPSKLEDEVLGSLDTLRKNVAQDDFAFAHPYGKRSSHAQSMVRNNFYAACSTEMDFASANSDPHFLPRIDMYYFSTNNVFSAVGTPSFHRFIQLRKAMRGLKQAFIGN